MTRPDQYNAMREFCRRCIQAALDASIDGADVQEWALELGMIYPDTATKKDCDGRNGYTFEGEPGDGIYRFEKWFEKTSPTDGTRLLALRDIVT